MDLQRKEDLKSIFKDQLRKFHSSSILPIEALLITIDTNQSIIPEIPQLMKFLSTMVINWIYRLWRKITILYGRIVKRRQVRKRLKLFCENLLIPVVEAVILLEKMKLQSSVELQSEPWGKCGFKKRVG